MTAITHKSDETNGRTDGILHLCAAQSSTNKNMRARGSRLAGRVVGAVKPSCAGMDDKNSHGGG